MTRRIGIAALLIALVAFGAGCGAIMSSATSGLADNLSDAIMNQNDPETVKDGAPSYLLLIDGLIEGDPKSESLLRAGATLNAAYASVFVKDPERAAKMAAKAKGYGLKALCLRRPKICEAQNGDFETFAAALAETNKKDVPALYTAALAWAGWIQANSSDWGAIADLAKVKAMMSRVIELDETYERGGAHLYMGVLETLLPPSMGGKPEVGKEHFERAIELSGGKDLMAKAMYAEKYARLVFNRELHDRLCNEVIAADPNVPGLTLTNTFAQQRAAELLASADDYF